jgi:amino acid adenylation domain-containing protein
MAGKKHCGSLVHRFAAAATLYRSRVAVSDAGGDLTYGELDQRSSRIARGLRAWGVCPGDRVGLSVQRGSPVLLGMLGILKAGASYVPMDSGYPPDRLRFMCEDSRPCCVLCDDPTPLPDGVPLIQLGELEAGNDDVEHDAEIAASVADLAYIIYTSGSTGRPKGVMVTHQNVIALLDCALPFFDVGPEDRWSLFTSHSFDVSVWEMWMSIVTGGTAVAVPADVARSPDAFVQLLAEQRVTVLNQVPSIFRHVSAAYVRAGAPQLALRYVIFAGETLDRSAIRNFLAAAPTAAPAWINMYGITETTVHATWKRLDSADLDADGATPIGCPLPHLRCFLLDDARRPVRKGDVGELWLSGEGVATGYFDRPELTAERFVSLAIDGSPTRCYRSGDLALERRDGELEYVGRADDQVKLRGFRIELGEIEHALREHPAVDDAVVVKVDGPVAPMLVAVVVHRHEGQRAKTPDVRSFLGQRLPSHMVPNRVLNVDTFPLSPSGKLDRRAVQKLAAANAKA